MSATAQPIAPLKASLRPLRYLVSFIGPGAVLVSLLSSGWWTFTAIVVPFFIIPTLELLLPEGTNNLEPDEERRHWKNRAYDAVIYSMVPVQYALLGLYLWRMAGDWTWLEAVGLTWSIGIACGVLGINVGHELGHRRKRSEQTMAKALLLTSGYVHFFVEHNRGHHTRVATEEDPASSRRGEWLYAFWVRSVVCGYRGAWALERERLERRNEPVWSWKNEMVRLSLAQAVFAGAVFAIGGVVGLVGWMIAALLGALLLETVNYIEHYGLARDKQEEGGYERVQPHHSWNSDHPLGRLLLFELTRHSDHHANARRPYQVLRSFSEAPQFPTGYPGMMVLAFCPPLWFAVTHRILDARAAEPPVSAAA